MYNDITGIILSGGKSSRMGENKSLLKIGGKTTIERIVELMSSLFPKVILSTNTPKEYKFLGIEMVQDINKDAGPLAGIHAGLKRSDTRKNFIISCDMLMMNEETIRFLIEFNTDKLITIAKADGFYQQLAGVYHKECLRNIQDILERKKDSENRSSDQKKRHCKVFALVESMDAEIIDIQKEMPDYKEGTYFNMNKPDEFEYIKHRLG
jgi:molybdenum cofactor guanylyltransferase